MKDNILDMLHQGHTYAQIISALGVAKSTIAYHAKKHNMSKGTKTFKIDWNKVQTTYDSNEICLAELITRENLNRSTVAKAIKSGYLIIDKSRENKLLKTIPNDMIFIENSPHDASVVKRRIKKTDLLPYKCSNTQCMLHMTQPTWNNHPIVLHLDHINGIRDDHRLQNLRWLCPNCHSQTATYCGRNKRSGALTENRTPDVQI